MRGGTIINYENGNTYDGDVNGYNQRHGQGKFTYPGGTYEGMFENNVPHGKGKIQYPDKSTYDGNFVRNKKNGRGKYLFADGRIYDGEWNDDMMNGIGNMTFPNGDKYVGQWKDDKINGNGKMTYNDGFVYDGEWMDDKEHGHGTYNYPDGKTTYEGEFESGKFSGLGVYTNVTPGYVFEYRGNHEDGFRHGEGIIKTICKGKIERMFVTYEKERMMSGKGRRIEHDGTIEDGDFVNTYFIKGTQTKPSGTIDIGHFENSIIKEGTRISYDNTYKYQYVGEFKNGKPDGMGSKICMDESNGWKYEGPFKNGLREGYGKFTFPDGRIYEGIFKNDQPVQRNQTKKLGPRNLMSAELGMSKQIFDETRSNSAKQLMTLKHAAKTEGGGGAEVSTMKHS